MTAKQLYIGLFFSTAFNVFLCYQCYRLTRELGEERSRRIQAEWITSDDAIKKEVKKLQGKWKIERVESEGKSWDQKEVDDRQMGVVIKDDMILFRLDHTDGPHFTLNPAKSPKWMDIESGLAGAAPTLAIYEVEGDTLK